MAYDAHDDGRRDFHFLYGRWRVEHRRLTARGVPMLAMGDEAGRSQGGNNNAYCQDTEMSWLAWGEHGERDAAFCDCAVMGNSSENQQGTYGVITATITSTRSDGRQRDYYFCVQGDRALYRRSDDGIVFLIER